jgi:hypothetical protein
MKAKGQDKSPPSNAIVRAMFDSNDLKTKLPKLPNVKPLNWNKNKGHRNCRSKLQPIAQMKKNKPILPCYLIHMNYKDTYSNKPSIHTSLRKIKSQ